MKRNRIQLLFTVSLICLVILSCKKEDINIDIESNKWVVVKMKSQGESTYTKARESYGLEFISDTTYTLKLDVNNCF